MTITKSCTVDCVFGNEGSLAKFLNCLTDGDINASPKGPEIRLVAIWRLYTPYLESSRHKHIIVFHNMYFHGLL